MQVPQGVVPAPVPAFFFFFFGYSPFEANRAFAGRPLGTVAAGSLMIDCEEPSVLLLRRRKENDRRKGESARNEGKRVGEEKKKGTHYVR